MLVYNIMISCSIILSEKGQKYINCFIRSEWTFRVEHIFNVRKVNGQYVNIRLYELTAIFYDGRLVYSLKKQCILQILWFVVVGL